jgi:hypothetical protein
MNSFDPIMILYFMLLLGPVQVLWAIFGFFATDYAKVRKHYLAYLAGVVVYFFIFGQLSFNVFRIDEATFANWFFFGGAGILAAYHICIAVYSMSQPPVQRADDQLAASDFCA